MVRERGSAVTAAACAALLALAGCASGPDPDPGPAERMRAELTDQGVQWDEFRAVGGAGEEPVFTWSVPDGYRCLGGLDPLWSTCMVPDPEPLADGPGIRSIGETMSDRHWQQMFRADRERVTEVSCGGRPVQLYELAEDLLPGGFRRTYTLVDRTVPFDSMTVRVVRDDGGTAVESLSQDVQALPPGLTRQTC
ncbi:hypothetical protein [Streptomyces sp. TLI_171]|uniref:hypothetical protein n=1 Tax=Streptomyces sp. TLI_171 TaxID=1938859 RepID=UPI000C3D84BB|nr:hypothetical protein [Streptomyces sp. TLI_171]RKE21857.1 hypothetical protein BX266_5261 [Streptomyces sp. TLI_171]